jgi:hypothetical protein
VTGKKQKQLGACAVFSVLHLRLNVSFGIARLWLFYRLLPSSFDEFATMMEKGGYDPTICTPRNSK